LPYKLFLFLEGDDDVRFFYQILVPLFRKKYPKIKIIKYAQLKPRNRENSLKSVQQMGADYIYVQDLDSAPCVTARKEEAIRLLNKAISVDDIAVVVKEIECWYLCGLDEGCCSRLLGKDLANTENFTKSMFDRLIPKEMPRVEFITKILGNFDFETGKRKNKSFRYFMKKWISSL